MAMRRDVFQAIADPTRRAIIGMVAEKTMNLNSVAENFKVSRPAISKHIKILTQCGLIEIRQKGRERFCEAKLDGLGDAYTWLEGYRKFWAGEAPAEAIAIAPVQVASAHAAPVVLATEVKPAAPKKKKEAVKAPKEEKAAAEPATMQGSLFGF